MDSEEPTFRYALKTIFNAHAADVRVVKPTCIPEGGLVTGARDNCVKVWTPEGKFFKEAHSFSGASNFISSLCVLPPSEQYPSGLVLAGSHDCSIYGFTSLSPEPVFRLLGHSGTVCSLSQGKFGCIVSGSWDKTARVWSGQQCVLTLQGHTQAVWATDVFPTQNLILTGSADHTIRLWRSSVCEKIFSGHEDCVRGLAVISNIKFLSCSNDNTVRLWLTSGGCLEVYKSHSDYIYDITLLSNGTDFATCGEDQKLKIWQTGKCVQTIYLEPKSIWSVTCLSNGDLAIGTSNGKIYIFEKVAVDYFEKVSMIGEGNFSLQANDDIPKMPQVPISATIYAGEKVIIYEDEDSAHMYVCRYLNDGVNIQKMERNVQYIEDRFHKKSAECVNTAKKTDYEFDVDVENNIYKLAFNKGENPWDVANKFVAKHNLLSEHISQIVEYIIQNSVSSFVNEYFPAKTCMIYLKINLPGLKAKLLEFSECVPKDKNVSPSEVDKLADLASAPNELTVEILSILDKVITWDDEFIFPVLDLLRIGVTSKGLQSKIQSKEFVNHLLNIFRHTNKSVNRVLISKIFCNMFHLDEARDILQPYQEKIFECIKDAFSSLDITIQKAGSALFMNFAIASHASGFNLNINLFCLNVVEILNYLVDSEALLRMMLAIGTVCSYSTLAITFFRSLEIKEILSKFDEYSTDSKIGRMLALLCGDF